MDECQEGNQRNCGRYTFRQADLAYLLIDEERMFPLAELLASLFRNTARTTLFTRMEKINTQRHFCNAEEIKLLKTVNGIHGSSAICTLIPETDVQKYCAVYMDRTVDLKLFSKGKRTSKKSAKLKDNQRQDGTEGTNSAIGTNSPQGKTSTSNVGSDKVNAINSLKKQNQASSIKQKINDGAKAKVSWEGQDTLCISNNSQLLNKRSGSEDSNSPATLAEHAVTMNCTQTLPSLSDQAIKARKKRKAKHSAIDDEFTKSNSSRIKRSKNKDKTENSICSPLKASIQEDCSNVIDGNSSLAMPRSSLTNNLENTYASSLSQCLTNANSEILFSDSSSNDSGFASTTTSERNISPLCSSKIASNLTPLTPLQSDPSQQSKKGTKSKKNKLENQDLDGKKPDPSLSPPPLVLKRQNNTWQVETKIAEHVESQKSRTTESPNSNPAKRHLKWPLSSTLTDKHIVKVENQEIPNDKFLKKKKKQKTNISDKDVVEVRTGVERNVVKKRRKRSRLGKDNKEDIDGTDVVNPVNLSDKGNNLSRTHPQCKKSGKRGKTNQTANSLNPKVKEAQTNLPSTENSQRNKKLAFAKTLKANKNFSLMSLFSSFPFLSMKNGDLCPTYSQGLPEHSKHSKPPSSRPIGKWNLGGPVFIHETRPGKTSRYRNLKNSVEN